MKGAAEFSSGRLGPCICSFVVCYTNVANKINNHIMRQVVKNSNDKASYEIIASTKLYKVT